MFLIQRRLKRLHRPIPSWFYPCSLDSTIEGWQRGWLTCSGGWERVGEQGSEGQKERFFGRSEERDDRRLRDVCSNHADARGGYGDRIWFERIAINAKQQQLPLSFRVWRRLIRHLDMYYNLVFLTNIPNKTTGTCPAYIWNTVQQYLHHNRLLQLHKQ